MKILHLTTHLNIGGITKYIFDLSQGLEERGVTCLVGSSGGDFQSYFKSAGIKCYELDIKTKFEFHPKLFIAAVKLRKFTRENSIDIIHAHTRACQVLACMVEKMTKIKVVSTCHGFFNANKISRKLFPCWGVKVIAVSDAVKDHLVNDFKLTGERVSVIYNGVYLQKFAKDMPADEKQAMKKNLGFSDGPVVGSIGRLSPVKGYDYLLHAFKRVIVKRPEVSLLIIGEGPYEGVLRKIARELAIEDSVFFMKAVVDTSRLLPVIDVYVFPSIQEGLGLSLLEAMASKRPCVATDVGGISNIIQNGKNGILVPSKDTYLLGNAIERVLDDREFSARISHAGFDTVKERFSLEIMADKTAEFYKQIISPKT